MSGKSPLMVSAEQRDGLNRLAVSANRAEADRARSSSLFPAGTARRSARFSGGGSFATKGSGGCARTRCATGALRSCAKACMRGGLHARGLGRHRATPRARLFSGESAGGLPRRVHGRYSAGHGARRFARLPALDNQGSHVWRRPGILMNVHGGSPTPVVLRKPHKPRILPVNNLSRHCT